MDPLNSTTEDVQWLRVDDVSAAGAVRWGALRLAEQLGFSEHRGGEVAIVATELATNLHRHAVAGSVVLRLRREDDDAALELVAVDHGPGVVDVDTLLVDGHSTGGTLGIGLGAVRRMASWFDAYSLVGRGTVIAVTFCASGPPRPRSSVGGLTRPMTGESVCGDAWRHRQDGGRTTVMLADGLGHGPMAATASQEAVRAFDAVTGDPLTIMAALHGAMGRTRGAAVAVAEIDSEAGRVRFAGIGNVAAWVDDGERRRGLVSHPGIVGHQIRSMRDITVDLPRDGLVILHSDGLTDKWDLRAYPGLRCRDVTTVAATIMRDAGIRHDDASIVVIRPTAPSTGAAAGPASAEGAASPEAPASAEGPA